MREFLGIRSEFVWLNQPQYALIDVNMQMMANVTMVVRVRYIMSVNMVLIVEIVVHDKDYHPEYL